MAQAMSTAGESTGLFEFSVATSTAKTSFLGVTATASAPGVSTIFGAKVTADAIAQGGSTQIFDDPDPDTSTAISIALPDKAFATTLIDGASNVAAALQGPRDEIFGAAILDFGDSIFDFSYRGDLLLGVIDGGADIIVNGTELFAIGDVEDTVFDLGSFGPNIELTISGGFGTFVVGGAVPEPSTWAMMLIGFAGLGYTGYRQMRAAKAPAA
jgi:hypothetical protein